MMPVFKFPTVIVVLRKGCINEVYASEPIDVITVDLDNHPDLTGYENVSLIETTGLPHDVSKALNKMDLVLEEGEDDGE